MHAHGSVSINAEAGALTEVSSLQTLSELSSSLLLSNQDRDSLSEKGAFVKSFPKIFADFHPPKFDICGEKV